MRTAVAAHCSYQPSRSPSSICDMVVETSPSGHPSKLSARTAKSSNSGSSKKRFLVFWLSGAVVGLRCVSIYSPPSLDSPCPFSTGYALDEDEVDATVRSYNSSTAICLLPSLVGFPPLAPYVPATHRDGVLGLYFAYTFNLGPIRGTRVLRLEYFSGGYPPFLGLHCIRELYVGPKMRFIGGR